jgi:alpha-ketoglutarate-dependent taurine dioxygenase
MKPSANDEPTPLDVIKARPVQVGPEGIAIALDGGFGAEISNIDLRQPISESLREQILAAFAVHHLLIFRGQQLGKHRMGEVAAMFGEVEGNVFRNPDGSTLEAIHQISNLDAAGRPAENPYLKSNYFWHSDKAYLPVPALLTMLHAVELPPSGGDTQFADMIRAYASLSDEVKRQVSALRAIHSLEYMRASTDDRSLTDEEKKAAPPVVHPLIRTHPVTHEESLFIGMYCSHIVGMDSAASRALLDRLLAHATQERFVYTHRWRPGDLVIWDNRCLLHHAVANYDMAASRRVLLRLVVKGSVAP